MMEDPFDLSPPSIFRKSQDEDKQKTPKKWGVVAGVSVGLVIFGAILLFAVSRPQISADSANFSAISKVDFYNTPDEIKTGEDFSITVSVSNRGSQAISNSFLLVKASGAELQGTLKLTDLNEGQEGYLRGLNESEKKYFDSGATDGFYWFIGTLNVGQTKSQQIVGSATGLKVRLEGKMLSSDTLRYACGFLNLSRCETTSREQQIGYEAIDLSVTEIAKISLRAGYNFVSLPYILSPVDTKNLLNLFKDRYARYFKPETAEYVDLYEADNANYIKPGVGFWLYASAPQEVELPENKSETNSNDNYTASLVNGWNHLGNPFTKRIVISPDKILLTEVLDDNTNTGTVYSLKSAIDNGYVSQPYVLKTKNFTDSNGNQSDLTKVLEWKALGLESTLDPFVGLLIKSEKKFTVTFPGKSIIAPGDLLADEEKAKISSWIIRNSLNEYGDPSGTVYSGGVPTDKNGNAQNRFDYILNKNSSRPWNK